MIDIILFFIALVWIGRIIANTISYIHLWYVKEYRPDRMIIHLKTTTQGKWIYFPKWKLPPLSLKTMTLFVLLIGTEAALFIVLPYATLFKLLIIDLCLFPLSFLYVALLRFPTSVYHAYKIQKARRLLDRHQWTSVIGITGSYGKTSTKEFLATILGIYAEVLKTEASKNSAIGIAETVLSTLTEKQRMFIVEMGAYEKGEISRMCHLVHPTVGIITAINAQHQDLFGSIETTMKAKYELVQGLGGKRIVVVNADIHYTHEMGEWAKRDGFKVWFVTRDKKEHPDALFFVDDVVSDVSSCSFTLHFKTEKQRITAKIRGEHFVMNAALAIAGAVASGVSFKDACHAAGSIVSVDRVMQPRIGKQGETLINDTFNNNPDAAIAALEYLEKFPKQKILVFQPMIELGSYTNESHERVGKKAGEVCDEIILTNSNFSQAFIGGVHSSASSKKVQILSTQAAASYIRRYVQKGDAVLFKGKEAEFVLKQLV